MKDHLKLFIALLWGCAVIGHCVGAGISNLSFDGADPSKLILKYELPGGAGFYGSGFTADLLPGWRLSDSSGSTSATMSFNEAALGPGNAGIWENRNFPVTGFQSTGYYLELDPAVEIRAKQNGETPPGLNGLIITRTGVVTSGGFFDPLTVLMNGEKVNVLSVYDNRHFLYDVSRFAGRTVELELVATRRGGVFPAGAVLIDSVAFIVPEPSVSLILCSAFLVLGFGRLMKPYLLRLRHGLVSGECGLFSRRR